MAYKADPLNDISNNDDMNLQYVEGSGNTFIQPAEQSSEDDDTSTEDVGNSTPGDYGFSTKVTGDDGNERDMTNTEFARAYDEHNPAPKPKVTPTPELTHNYDYQDILKQYEPKEDSEKQQRLKRTRRNIAALGDGISAVANLVGTSQGAREVYDPSKNLSSHLKERYDKIKAEQEKDRTNYRELQKHAADQEQKENTSKLSLYTTQKAKDDADNAKAQARYNAKRKADIDAYNKDQVNKRTAEHNKEMEEQGRKQLDINQGNLDERKRHDLATEGIQRTKASKESKNSENPMTFSGTAGTVSRPKPPTDAELDGIISEMQRDGVFGKDAKGKEINIAKKVSLGLMSRGQAIQQAMNSARGIQIMCRHGFKKQ